MRVVFAVPPFIAILIAMLVSGSTADISDMSEFGRMLFIVVSALMMLLGSLAAPLVMARSILSERDEGTLDLLALTGLSPGQVLWGTMSARVLWFMLALFAAAPLILLVPTLGGVGLREVVALLVVVPTMAITFGVISARLALASHSVAVAAIGTAGWAVLIGLALPLRLVIALHQYNRSQSPDVYFKVMSPLFAVGVDDWSALVSIVPWLIGAVWIAWATTFAFRRGVATGWDPKTRSWPGRIGLYAHLFVLAASWGTVEVLAAMDNATPVHVASSTPVWLWPIPLLIGSVASQIALISATVVYVRGLCAIVPWLARPRSAGGRRRLFGRVWSLNPVVWREFVTRSHGAMSRGVWLLVGGWALLTAIVLVAGDFDEVLSAFFIVLAALGTLLVSVLLTASSVVDERRRGTLPLLMATRMWASTVVTGKVLATMLRIAPLALLGSALLVLAFPETLWPDRVQWEYAYEAVTWREEAVPERPSPAWLTFLYVGRLITVPMWVLAAWTTLLHLVAALGVRIRRTGAAFATSVAVGLAVPLVVIVLAILFDDTRWPILEMVGQTLWPFQNAFFSRYAILPPELPVSTAFWCLMSVASWALASRWMARWGVKDRR